MRKASGSCSLGFHVRSPRPESAVTQIRELSSIDSQSQAAEAFNSRICLGLESIDGDRESDDRDA